MYKIGSTKSVKKVAISNPPITTVANGRCTSAPDPLLNAIGKKPKEATKAVIKTGRKRVFVPIKTKRVVFKIPCSFSRLYSETNTIPFNTATPNKAINPTPALMLKGMSRSTKK